MKIKRKLQLIKEFGLKIFLADFLASNVRISNFTARLRDRVFLNWLKKNYGNIILKYKNAENSPVILNETENSSPIWCVWWQGEENLPEVIDLCFSNIRKYCGNHPFKIITEKNYREYVELPEYIIEKLNAGKITLTHFSDIMRMYLLSRYGGLWLDATIFVNKNIPEKIFSAPYFTIKRKKNIHDRNISQGRWTGFLQASQKGCKLCSFASDIMFEYWKTHEILFDYVFLDYIIALAYEEISECKNLLDSVPLNNPEIDNLQPLLNLPFNSEIYKNLISDTIFFKLTWKQKFYKNISENKTFYGHICE